MVTIFNINILSGHHLEKFNTVQFLTSELLFSLSLSSRSFAVLDTSFEQCNFENDCTRRYQQFRDKAKLVLPLRIDSTYDPTELIESSGQRIGDSTKPPSRFPRGFFALFFFLSSRVRNLRVAVLTIYIGLT